MTCDIRLGTLRLFVCLVDWPRGRKTPESPLVRQTFPAFNFSGDLPLCFTHERIPFVIGANYSLNSCYDVTNSTQAFISEMLAMLAGWCKFHATSPGGHFMVAFGFWWVSATVPS